MKLPIPSIFQKKEASNYILSLLLRDEKATAIVLEEIDGKLKHIGTASTVFPRNLEDTPFEELLETLDKTISKAEENLPPNVETEKTVFGVKESWVEDKKIKKEYLSNLKRLSDSLSLQPIGFMITSEAIAHLLTKEEGAPLSAVLAEIGKQQATLTLFRAGNILEIHTARIEDSIPLTVDKLLHHFTTEVLPSRIIVFDGGNAEELAQEFVAHHWSKSVPFLHIPQISVLPEGFDAKSMVYGTAEQLSYTVLDAFADIKPITLDVEESKGEAKRKTTKANEKKDEETVEEKDEEVTQDETPIDNEKNQAKDSKLDNNDDFGFVLGQDISQVKPHAIEKASKTFDNDAPTEGENFTFHQRSQELTPAAIEVSGNRSSFISNFLQKMPNFSFLNGHSLQFRKKMIFIPIALVILIGITLLYIFSLKATIVLHMQTRGIDESTDITLQTDSSNDLSQKIIAAEEVQTSLDGTVSTNATGKKDVGDKAKGTVTIYNNSESKRTIPAGIVITSANGLDFVTDKEVSVASQSGDVFSGTKPGTVQVAVTAKEIGSSSNLPSGTKFTLALSSSLAAKNDSAFSGGTKKEVTVVAKKDLTTLDTDLVKTLQDKANETIKSKLSDDRELLPFFTNTTLSKKTYDQDIDDEAKKITLKGTVTFTSFSFSKEDLKKLAESTLQGRYSDDLAISDKGISASLEDIKKISTSEVDGKLVIKAGLLPKINKDTIQKDLAGKSFNDAESYLGEIPQVKSAEIILTPNIPFLPKLLPRISNNITISLQAND